MHKQKQKKKKKEKKKKKKKVGWKTSKLKREKGVITGRTTVGLPVWNCCTLSIFSKISLRSATSSSLRNWYSSRAAEA